MAGFLALVDAVNTYDSERAGFLTFFRFHVRRCFAEVSGNRGERRRAVNYAISLDEPTGDESDTTRLDMLVDPHDAIADVDRRVWFEALRTEHNTSLDTLPHGGETLRERYFHNSTQAAIAKRSSVTPELIRQREKQRYARCVRRRVQSIETIS